MDIGKIEQEYPLRILSRMEIDHRSFDLVFDLPRKRHLHVVLSIFEQETDLEVGVSLQVTSPLKLHRSEVERIRLDGEAKDIPGLLRDYLLLCVGDLERHTYEHSLTAALLQHSAPSLPARAVKR
jgi:hypothetical protein